MHIISPKNNNMSKKLVFAVMLVGILSLSSYVFASSSPSGDPFQAIWDTISSIGNTLEDYGSRLNDAENVNSDQTALIESLQTTVSQQTSQINELIAKLEQVPWDLTGTYIVYWGGNRHQMVVDNMDLVTGEFSGHGTFLDAPGYFWTMTGHLDGYSFNFRIVYTETLPGYYVDTTGTVAPDGSLSGSGVSSIGENFTFHSTSGAATKNN